MIKGFFSIMENEVSSFGGKAVNLGILSRAGFNVPKGVCISSDTEINDETITEAHTKFKELGSNVSVRSSASVEDSKTNSFAGQFDSFLNINNKEKLVESIKKVKESVKSNRVIAYQKEHADNVNMGIIIQKMVHADFSGIIFTKDPIKKEHILIEIADGLGEDIVSGSVTPSNFFVDDENSIVKSDNQHEVQVALIIKLAKIARKIENVYGTPQDIEFAVKDDEIFILQSRPITT